MSKVYSNSICNISAAAAPSSEYSIFNSRDVVSAVIETINLSIANNDAMTYFIQDSSLWFTDCSLWSQEISCSVVNSRAWVLQERLLSIRNLYFGKSQLY